MRGRKGELVRLIDADALLDSVKIQMLDEDYDITCVISDIENAPTIDAVEVVRCKECKYYHPIGICIEQSSAVCADSFCCWAERRTDERPD